MKSSRDSLPRSRLTRRTATVTISAPLASMARAVSCPDLYFPVPTIRRERNWRPAMMRESMPFILSRSREAGEGSLLRRAGSHWRHLLCPEFSCGTARQAATKSKPSNTEVGSKQREDGKNQKLTTEALRHGVTEKSCPDTHSESTMAYEKKAKFW